MTKTTKRDEGGDRRPLSSLSFIPLTYLYRWTRKADYTMPERQTAYIALCHSLDQVHEWIHEYGIQPRSIRIVSTMRDVRGVGEFFLLIFSGWMESGGDEKMAVGDWLMGRAAGIYLVDTHEPHVNRNGLISFWVRKAEER